jgi:hypothetical protein
VKASSDPAEAKGVPVAVQRSAVHR